MEIIKGTWYTSMHSLHKTEEKNAPMSGHVSLMCQLQYPAWILIKFGPYNMQLQVTPNS